MQKMPAATAPDAAGHEVTVAEQGSFAFARCVCGWRGPGRRARSAARTDAENHAG